MLQLQDLRVDQVKKSCIGLTQENSIENSAQDYLSYISRLIVMNLNSLSWIKAQTLILE